MSDAIRALEHYSNRNQLQPTHGYSNETGFLRFQLAKSCWLEPHVEVPFLLGSVLSSNGVDQIRGANPLLTCAMARSIIDESAMLMFRCSKISQLQRCIAQAKQALFAKTPLAESASLARALCERRHHAMLGQSGVHFDPRFLCFEFASGYMLYRSMGIPLMRRC